MLTKMIASSEQASRTTCAICRLRSNCILCDTCKAETREDFYLLLLTRFKDESNDFFGLQATCIDMHDAVDHYVVPDIPVMSFDQSVHTVDEHAKEFLEEHTMISTNEMIPVEVAGDGDCLFHTLCTFYPTMTIDELRARCINELCLHQQHYETIKTEMGLDLVDDESVQDHVLRIINNQQYTGVLTFAALSTVIGRPIESIYPSVNDNDEYCEVLNTIFVPRNQQLSSPEMPLRIMWSGPEKEADRIWRSNHFTPLLSTVQSSSALETTTSFEVVDDDVASAESTTVLQPTDLRTSKSTIRYTNQIEDEKENDAEPKSRVSLFNKRQVFLEAPAIIQYMIDSVKDGKLQPRFLKPSTIYNASISNVEEASLPSLTKVRDRKQVYNARQKRESNVEEYLAIMRNLEKSSSVIARFSMSREEAPVLVLSQPHMIKELKRCCITSSDQMQPSVLCIDTTFNLGRFFVTPIAFRNTAVQYRKTKKAPIFIGPIMIHYRDDAQSYQEVLEYVRRELNDCSTLVIGSDGAKAIQKAVGSVFPDSTHLYCTRHMRQNIERQLIKSRTTLDERQGILELIFDSSESLIQSEIEEEFQDRLNELCEYWRTIQRRDETRVNGATDFFQWFNQYQANVFRNHLIAAIRIPINFLDRHGASRLFYNNDIESMNHAFKIQTNWELRSLSEVIDILGNLIATQKNESIRALHDSGDLEILPPYSRFVTDSHIWSAKTIEERKEIIENYYNYVPASTKPRRSLNTSPKAGRKPGRSNVRGSSTRTRKKK
ncbi:unnamed protein product [Rotaria sp. Silwood1]|nr:unnamed protein product [Rotaria sp. Silwood1]